MEPAIHDLTRELEAAYLMRIPELEVELEVVDDILLDPWFATTEDQIRERADDPDAVIIEIKIGPLLVDHGTGFAESRWAF